MTATAKIILLLIAICASPFIIILIWYLLSQCYYSSNYYEKRQCKKLSKHPYDFDVFPMLIGTVFVACIFVMAFINSYHDINSLDIKNEVIGHFLVYAFMIGLFLIVFDTFISNLKDYVKFKTTLKKGTIIDGKISSFCKIDNSENTSSNYYLYIKYYNPNNNEECSFLTRKINFDLSYLGSDKCNVYFDNGIAIAYDFLSKEQTGEKIELPLDNNPYYNRAKSKSLMFYLIVIASLVISAIITYFQFRNFLHI